MLGDLCAETLQFTPLLRTKLKIVFPSGGLYSRELHTLFSSVVVWLIIVLLRLVARTAPAARLTVGFGAQQVQTFFSFRVIKILYLLLEVIFSPNKIMPSK
jgi:hypothetical protein